MKEISLFKCTISEIRFAEKSYLFIKEKFLLNVPFVILDLLKKLTGIQICHWFMNVKILSNVPFVTLDLL